MAFKVPHTVRRKRDGMRGFLLPLALLSVTFNHFPKRDVQQPQEALLLHAPIRPSCDPRANALALFTTELLSHVLQAEQKDPHLYHYVTEQVRWLEKIPAEGLPSYHLSLLVGICHHLGILPTTAEYKPGYVLRLEEGCFAPPFSVTTTLWWHLRHSCISSLLSHSPSYYPCTTSNATSYYNYCSPF